MFNLATKLAGWPAGSSGARPWWHWLDVAPAAWLAVVISAYGVLAMTHTVPTQAPVAGVAAADPLALPFLVLTVAAGIIRYVWAPRSKPLEAVEPIIASSLPRDTS